jgi:hypothetical protein
MNSEERLKQKVIRAIEKKEDAEAKPRWMRILPAIGGAVGTAYALKNPKAFLPTGRGGNTLKSKAIAAALGAGGGATLGWLPQVFSDAAHALKK